MVRKFFGQYPGSPGHRVARGQHRRTRSGRGATIPLAGCLLLFGLGRLCSAGEGSPAKPAIDAEPRPPLQTLTNVSQLSVVPHQEFFHQVPFRLTGTVTMVDTNRHLVILQDATGAVALDLTPGGIALRPGDRISVEGTNCSPYVANFPDYPYRPSGWDMRDSFEAPSNWGEYHLTRMRGYVRPPATGEYTFWIASDNSSELWLSADDDPARIRKIAFLKPGYWVSQRDWSRYPSQRSEPISLQAGQTYYIEAFQEQLAQDDNLSVAWQGPGFLQAVIPGQYLEPWVENSDQATFARTNGILREYWTNYSAGNLADLADPRPFESELSLKDPKVTVLGKSVFPEPVQLALDQPLQPTNRYRWAETEGRVSFLGLEGGSAVLELSGNGARAQVSVSDWPAAWPHHIQDSLVRVQGVCKGAYDANGLPVPGLIWVPPGGSVSFVTPATAITNSSEVRASNRVTSASAANVAFAGYWTRAIVTLNGRFFNQDCLFVQDETSSYLISQAERQLGDLLRLGHEVELTGNLVPGRPVPTLLPMVLIDLGWHPLPEPATQPVEIPVPSSRNGRWTEVTGVVRLVNPDGTLRVMQVNTPLSVLLGNTPTNLLAQYVDAAIRVRGVLSMHLPAGPTLLVPSRSFLEVEEDAPAEPFTTQSRLIARAKTSSADLSRAHRVQITGVVTYRNHRSVFVQDTSSGLRVETAGEAPVKIGDTVEVVGFPVTPDSGHALTEALVRPTRPRAAPAPVPLVANDVAAEQRSGTLVWVRADLVAQSTKGANQILVLQSDQRVFEAVLPLDQGTLPALAQRSALRLTGVCEVEPVAPLTGDKREGEASSAGSLRLWLRSPHDVLLLSGPPWWTWKRAATLVGALLATLIAAVLWVHLLHRRLERQHAARLAFSRQILQSQESERRRIAANLHDSLGQNLLVIKNQAGLAMQTATDETLLRNRLSEISGVATQALEEVRQITSGLRPYQLDRLGLTRSICTLVNQVSENSPTLFASHVDNIDGLFDDESEIHVYRIVQESLNNVVKHSGATEATVVIKRLGNQVSLSVRDNGRGFDAALLDASGSGLNGLRERTRILNGTLIVDSTPGAGTDLAFSFPASAQKHEA